MRRIKSCVAAMLMCMAAIGLASAAFAGDALVIRHDDEIVRQFATDPGDRFTIAWVHSVEEEAWEETFEITPDRAIHLVATRFKTFGAGTPDGIGTETRIEDGWVVMEGIDRPVDPYAVQAAEAEDYRIVWKGETWPLARPGPPRILTFAVEAADASPSKAHFKAKPLLPVAEGTDANQRSTQ